MHPHRPDALVHAGQAEQHAPQDKERRLLVGASRYRL